MMVDAISQFRDAMRAAGLQPPEYIKPGKIYRFPGRSKRPGNRAGWCFLSEDGRAGCFGDWSSGLKQTWRADAHQSPSRSSKRCKAVLSSEGHGDTSSNERQIVAAKRAAAIWKKASPAPTCHPYLVRKRIRPHRARIYREALVLPVIDRAGTLSSLQFIAPDGGKRLLAGGRKQGCFIPVAGYAQAPAKIVVCEGWATGCTLAELFPSALVLAAIDAGNLLPVASMARCCWPTAKLIIAGDDDRRTPGNPGRTKAQATALAAKAELILPDWPPDAPDTLTDFNDLVTWMARGGK